MIIRSSTVYLELLQKYLISSQFIISIIFFIEYLPVICNNILSAFYFSRYSFPSNFTVYFDYFSFYIKVHNVIKPIKGGYLLLVIITFLIIYIVYKFILINIPYIFKSNLLHLIMINFFELLLFRLFVIFIVDIEIIQIINGSLEICILSIILMAITTIGAFVHYNMNFIYINVNLGKRCFLENKFQVFFDKYLLIIKIVICLKTNIDESVSLKNLMNLIIFSSNIFVLAYIVFSLSKDKLSYLSADFSMSLHVYINFSLGFVQIFMIIPKHFNDFFFYFGLVNSVLISICLSFLLQQMAVKKMFDKKNKLGTMIFIIKEARFFNKKNLQSTFLLIANAHGDNCKGNNCKICAKFLMSTEIKNEPLQNLTYEKICLFAYKSLFKGNKLTSVSSQKNINESLPCAMMITLYMKFIEEKKNLVKIVLQYYKIKSFFTKIERNGKNKNNYSSNCFSFNYFINLEFLYYQITQGIFHQREEQKMFYLITINSYVKKINNFLNSLLFFFEIDLKLPEEIIKLASRYTQLKDSIDISFLNSKEYKYNYPCVASGFIMEEIFNEQFQTGLFNRESINLIEELISAHYNEDRNILALYDIAKKTITIEESGKELLFLKKKNFNEIFPVYLKYEGIKSFISVLTKNQGNNFQFYFKNDEKKTIEVFRFKFSSIPSCDFKNYSIYIICNYKIEKESMIVFERRKINGKDKTILIDASEKGCKMIKITPEQILYSIQNNIYIELSDIFDIHTGIINYSALNNCITKKLGGNEIKKKKKILSFELRENFDYVDIYTIKTSETNIPLDRMTTNVNPTIIKTITQMQTNNNIDDDFSAHEYLANLDKHTTHTNQTGFSSSFVTNGSSTMYRNINLGIKKKEEIKIAKFYSFKFYILSFNILSMAILLVFVVYEIQYNTLLEKTFKIIVHFNDFQNYFYHTALSILSLSCVADSFADTQCDNQYLAYSKSFIEENNLTENELFVVFISQELLFKSEEIVDHLKTWESEREYIKSDELSQILEKDFYFTGIEENNGTINFINITLSFEDAVKRFANTIIQVASSSEFLTMPVYAITTNGDDYIDMSNVMKGKEPDEEGFYLLDIQKYYYTILLNYQKYLLILLSIGDLLKIYYDNKLTRALRIKYSFSLSLFAIHCLFLFMCMVFINIFKKLHSMYFIRIYQQITNQGFKTYFHQKIDNLMLLLEFYKENPIELIKKIERLNSKEKSRRKEEYQKKIDTETIDEQNKEKIDYNEINKIYNKRIIFNISLLTICLFVFYTTVIGAFFIGIVMKIQILHNMNRYTKNNFDMSVNAYINLGLIQIMSLTNQTDIQLEQYFGSIEKSDNLKGYVRSRLEESFQLIFEIYKMEKKYSYFSSLSSKVKLNCDTLYEDFKDSLIESMQNKYPESDYNLLFTTYCYSMRSIQIYNDEKLLLTVIVYQNEKLLDQLIEHEDNTSVSINNKQLLYTVYTELLIIIRPIRGYLYTNSLEEIVIYLVNDYKVFIIIFLVVNFMFEILIFIVIKCFAIDAIIKYMKEIVLVVKSFQCY